VRGYVGKLWKLTTGYVGVWEDEKPWWNECKTKVLWPQNVTKTAIRKRHLTGINNPRIHAQCK